MTCVAKYYTAVNYTAQAAAVAPNTTQQLSYVRYMLRR
jgi:hypothetical protein